MALVAPWLAAALSSAAYATHWVAPTLPAPQLLPRATTILPKNAKRATLPSLSIQSANAAPPRTQTLITLKAASTDANLKQNANAVASLAIIVAADAGLKTLFKRYQIAFPASLAGMLFLFTCLTSLKSTRPTIANKLYGISRPGYALLSRWLAVFFVPNLVLLPLVLQLNASEGARLAALIIVGSMISLLSCAVVALTALKFTSFDGTNAPEASAPAPDVKVASSQAPTSKASKALESSQTPPNAFASSTLGLLSTGCTFFATVAVLSNRGLLPLPAGIAVLTCQMSLLFATLLGFAAGSSFPVRVQRLVHPLLFCTGFTLSTILLLSTAIGLPPASLLRSYLVPGGAPVSAAGNLLLAMLGPATLSFGIAMYERRALMRSSAVSVGSSVICATIVGVFGTALAARSLVLPAYLKLATISRQVTAPLAIAIAGMIGADPSLAATIVVLTGLLIANFGASLLDSVGIRSPVARGLAMGGAGHGLGTAALGGKEPEAFPFAAIAMVLNATLSTILLSFPVVRKLVRLLLKL